MSDQPEPLSVGVESDGSLDDFISSASSRFEGLAETITDAFAGATQSAQAFITTMNEGFAATTANLQAMNAELANTVEAIQAASDAGDEGGATGGSSGGSSLFGIGHAFSVAGSVGGAPGLRDVGAVIYLEQGLQRISDLLPTLSENLQNAGGLFGTLAAGGDALFGSFGAVLAVLTPVIAALGVLTIAYEAFVQETQDASNNLKTAADALKTEFNAAATETAPQIQANIAKAQQDKAAADAEIARINGSEGGAFAAQQTNQGDLAARIQFLLASTQPGFQELGKQLQDAQARSDAAAAELEGYNNALGDSAVAARTAAANTAAASDLWIQSQVAADQALGESSDTIKKKIEADKDEAAAIESQLPTLKNAAQYSTDAAATFQKFSDRLQVLNGDITNLSDNILPVVERREAENDALKTTQQLVDDRAKYLAADADRVAAFNAQQATQKDDFDLRQQQAQDTFDQARQQKTADFDAAVDDIETKATADRLKTQQDAAQASQQAWSDYQAKLQDIQSKSQEKLQEDAANLDAVAVQNDLASRNEQVSSATNTYNQQQAQRQQDEQTKLNEITTNANAEVAQRTAAFNAQQSQDAANFALKQKQAQDNFDQQQTQEAANFKRTEQQQSDSFTTQQNALEAKLKGDEATIAASYVLQAAAAVVGGFNSVVSFANGVTSAHSQAVAAGVAAGEAFATAAAYAAAVAAATAAPNIINPQPYVPPAGVNPLAGTSTQAFTDANGTIWYTANNASPGDLVPSGFGSISNSGGANGASGSIYGGSFFGGSDTIFGTFASGGVIPPFQTGWVGSELVRAGAGGASVSPASGPEPKGKQVIMNGDIYFGDSMATAQQKAQVQQWMQEAFDQIQ